MEEKIIKLESLFEEITDVQNKIKTKTQLRNEYIISHVNPVFEEIKDKINKYIKLIDNVCSLDQLPNIIMENGKMISKSINNNQYEIFVYFNYKNKKCEYSYKHKGYSSSRNSFAMKVTQQEKWITEDEQSAAYSLTCTKFTNIFGTVDNIYVILEIFEDIIQHLVTALTNRLQKLKEESSAIIIPQINYKENDENQKIILGEFDNYQIILEKKTNRCPVGRWLDLQC